MLKRKMDRQIMDSGGCSCVCNFCIYVEIAVQTPLKPELL
jgi:hypothetical protein